MDRRRNGSLKVARAFGLRPPTKVAGFSGESFRSPDRGVASGANFAFWVGRDLIAPSDFLTETSLTDLKRTPLYALHKELGARLVPFALRDAGQYPTASWRACAQRAPRPACSTFAHGTGAADGEARAECGQGARDAGAGDIAGLAPGQQRYTQFTNESGHPRRSDGHHTGDHLLLVINAACKAPIPRICRKHLTTTASRADLFARAFSAAGTTASQT